MSQNESRNEQFREKVSAAIQECAGPAMGSFLVKPDCGGGLNRAWVTISHENESMATMVFIGEMPSGLCVSVGKDLYELNSVNLYAALWANALTSLVDSDDVQD